MLFQVEDENENVYEIEAASPDEAATTFANGRAGLNCDENGDDSFSFTVRFATGQWIEYKAEIPRPAIIVTRLLSLVDGELQGSGKRIN